jgi:hypothetical protein
MQAFQQRVVDEKTELDKKLDNLTQFIKSSKTYLELPEPERARLLEQRLTMQRYSEILADRIAAFAV